MRCGGNETSRSVAAGNGNWELGFDSQVINQPDRSNWVFPLSNTTCVPLHEIRGTMTRLVVFRTMIWCCQRLRESQTDCSATSIDLKTIWTRAVAPRGSCGTESLRSAAPSGILLCTFDPQNMFARFAEFPT